MRTIYEEAKTLIDGYQSDMEMFEGLTFNQKKLKKTIAYMSNSKYESGDRDAKGREKPYANIVNANVEVANVATDIDRKDVTMKADNPSSHVQSFIGRRELYNWMKDEHFGTTLNEMNSTRNRWGGVLVKKSNPDSRLKIEVVAWLNCETDPGDILNNPIIEYDWLTITEVMKKSDVWANTSKVKELHRKLQKKQGYSKVEIWDIHGEFDSKFLDLTDEGELVSDEDTGEYVRQHHILAIFGGRAIPLFWEEEKENPYKYRALRKREKVDLGEGFVEAGAESQVWYNDAVIAEKYAFEIASKLLLKTNSKKLGSNVLRDVDNGHIFQLEDGKDINVVNTLGQVPQVQPILDRWQKLYDRRASITDALRGETPPSGQAYRLGALVTQQSGSSFDDIREDMGLFLEEIFSDWVIPYLEKRMNRAHLLNSDLFTPEELMQIDTQFSIARANDQAIDAILEGNDMDRMRYEQIQGEFRQLIQETGAERFFDIPKDYFKDMSARVSIETTNEQRNKMAMLETLSSILTSYLSNPQAISQDPFARQVFGQILELTGANVSSIMLPMAQQPQMGQTQQMNGKVEPVMEEKKMNLPGPQAVTNG